MGAPLNILLTVDPDVRADIGLPLDEEFPHSIPSCSSIEDRISEQWRRDAADRAIARMWGY